MTKVLLISQMNDVKSMMDPQIFSYLNQGRTETFERFATFYLIAFDWYDIHSSNTDTSKILIYIDKEDSFFFCEDDRVLKAVQKNVLENPSNEKVLYQFFVSLLKSDMDSLDKYEDEITEAENSALTGEGRHNYINKIVMYRKELLRRKRYYEQLVAIFENLSADDEGFLSRETKRHFSILQNRAERFRSIVLNLRDYVTQMREAYQSQIDIQQNQLMRLFTVITAIFLPLNLLVGWYGMNFKNMPELAWRYGYLGVIIISVIICVFLIIWFKKRRWL